MTLVPQNEDMLAEVWVSNQEKAGLNFLSLIAFIEGKCGLDSLAFHHHKRHAVGQRIAFIGLVGEFAPCLAKHRFVDVYEGDNAALEQYLADRDRLGVMAAAIEECHDLVEYIRGRYECNAPLADFTPSGDRRGVVLVVRRFQRDQKTGVEKIS